MRAALALALAAAAGCSAVLKFHECDQNSDCIGRGDGGPTLYCTPDHMCVDGVPDALLCSQSIPAAGTAISDGALVVAGLYKLSGPNAVNDHAIRQAADLAAIELGTLGINVVHFACDTGGRADQAARAFQIAATQLHAAAVIGPDTSDEVVKGVAPLVKQYGVVVVSPSATAVSISTLDDAGLIWRTCPSNAVQAKVLAQLVPTMTGTRTTKVDLVYVDQNTYAADMQQAFNARWQGMLSKSITFATGQAATVPAAMDAPDYAVLIADTDAPPLVAALQSAPGQAMTQYLMTDSAMAPTLWGPPSAQVAWSMLSRVRGTAPALPVDPDPSAGVYRSFASAYQAHFNGEDPANTAFVANAYDAFYSIAVAAAVAGARPGGAAIAAAMKRLSDVNAQKFPVGVNGYNAAVQALSASPSATIDLFGASGPISFDPVSGDVLSAPIEVWKIVMASDGSPTFAPDMVVTPP